MSPLSEDVSQTLTTEALRRLVVELSQRLGAIEEQVAELGDQLTTSEAARGALQVENRDLRDNRCCVIPELCTLLIRVSPVAPRALS